MLNDVVGLDIGTTTSTGGEEIEDVVDEVEIELDNNGWPDEIELVDDVEDVVETELDDDDWVEVTELVGGVTLDEDTVLEIELELLLERVEELVLLLVYGAEDEEIDTEVDET